MVKQKEHIISEIESAFVYEMAHYGPVYYRGYKRVLRGGTTLETIKGDSSLQAWLKARFAALLFMSLPKAYLVTSGEQGLRLKKNRHRSADIAIFKKDQLILENKYSNNPPEVIIEVDTKADFDSLGDGLNYFETKNEELHDFGVQKIIWIFTDSEQVKVFEKGQAPQSFDWTEDVAVIEDISFNMKELLDELEGK